MKNIVRGDRLVELTFLSMKRDHIFVFTCILWIILIFSSVAHASDVIAEAGQNQTVRINEDVYFDGSKSIGDIIRSLWEFGDGHIGYGLSQAHRYTSEGTYTVILTIENGDNLTDKDFATVTVKDINVGAEIVLSDEGVFYDEKDNYIACFVDNDDISNYHFRFSIEGDVVQPWSGLSYFTLRPGQFSYGSKNLKTELVNTSDGRYTSETTAFFIYRKPIGPPIHHIR